MEVAINKCSSRPRDDTTYSRDDPSRLPPTNAKIESPLPGSEWSPEHSTIEHFHTTNSITSVEGGQVLCEPKIDVVQTSIDDTPPTPPPPPPATTTTPSSLTAEFLEVQNKLMKSSSDAPVSAIRAWAANLPEISDNIHPEPTESSHIFELQTSPDFSGEQPHIQETKDVFTETQKIAYVGLCALTSLEVVHDYRGKDFTYARMSSDNWQRKLMRMIYMHMDISADEIKMIESLSKHEILPSDLVHQFTAQGETTTVNMEGFQEVKLTDDTRPPSSCTSEDKSKEMESMRDSSSTTNSTRLAGDSPRVTLSSDEKTSPRNSTSKTIYDTLEPSNEFVIDLRWTVMCDLLLLFLGAENFDARSRVFIARIASYLDLDWLKVIGFEKRITDQLITNASLSWETETANTLASAVTTATDMDVSIKNENEKKSRNKERRKRRYVMIGLATIGGGLILGLSAGLMAPIIAGGLGSILTTVGVSGASSFLGGTTGIALITGAATGIGSGMGAKGMRKRMKTINTFEFFPVQIDDRVNCVVTISGWLPKKGIKDLAALPFSTLDPIMGDHYTLYWEPEMLEALGSAFKIFATEVVTFSIQQALAHTIMSALFAGLAWPLALTKLGYLVDNPWHNGLDRARLAGLVLADSIMNRNLGARPVTLIGYSLGARVIFYCLLELSRMNAYGLVENVALFGTPVSASKAQWKECTSVVAGRFINGYATSDWLLGFLFRASTAGLGNVAGLRPLHGIEGNRVQNLDCTDLVKGHLSYRTAMPKLLKRAGFIVTSDELPDGIKKEEEEDEEFILDLSGAKDLEHFRPATMTKGSSVSSLKSGKASIQYPPPKTKCNPHRLGPDESSPRTSTQMEESFTLNVAEDQGPASAQGSVREETKPVVHSAAETDRVSLPSATVPKEDTRTNTPNIPDDEIIAEIIAKAAAVSKSPGQYSSLSSGRASIAQPRSSVSSTSHPFPSPPTGESSSEPISSPGSTEDSVRSANRRSISSSSLFTKSSSLFKLRKRSGDDDSQRELAEAGIEVKEIKSTLGCMVVPGDVVNPMPKISLEKPQYARINR